VGKPKEEDHLEELDEVVGNTEKDLEERVWDIVDWNDLAQNWNIGRAFCQHSYESASFLTL
jgi:hypothetical protein